MPAYIFTVCVYMVTLSVHITENLISRFNPSLHSYILTYNSLFVFTTQMVTGDSASMKYISNITHIRESSHYQMAGDTKEISCEYQPLEINNKVTLLQSIFSYRWFSNSILLVP